jgi:hypothetical protein
LIAEHEKKAAETGQTQEFGSEVEKIPMIQIARKRIRGVGAPKKAPRHGSDGVW